MNYDDWKADAPELYDWEPRPEEGPTCVCGQPLDGGERGRCTDCLGQEIVKICACGIAHTREDWLALRRVGTMRVPGEGYEPEDRWELRNCHCGSTLLIRNGK
jgi:hypothetical protein